MWHSGLTLEAVCSWGMMGNWPVRGATLLLLRDYLIWTTKLLNQKRSYSPVWSSGLQVCGLETRSNTYTDPRQIRWNEWLKFNHWPCSESVGMSEPCTGLRCYQDHQMRMQWKQEDIYISLGKRLKLETVVVENSKLEPLLRNKTYAVSLYRGNTSV